MFSFWCFLMLANFIFSHFFVKLFKIGPSKFLFFLFFSKKPNYIPIHLDSKFKARRCFSYRLFKIIYSLLISYLTFLINVWLCFFCKALHYHNLTFRGSWEFWSLTDKSHLAFLLNWRKSTVKSFLSEFLWWKML